MSFVGIYIAENNLSKTHAVRLPFRREGVWLCALDIANESIGENVCKINHTGPYSVFFVKNLFLLSVIKPVWKIRRQPGAYFVALR